MRHFPLIASVKLYYSMPTVPVRENFKETQDAEGGSGGPSKERTEYAKGRKRIIIMYSDKIHFYPKRHQGGI